MSQGLSVTEADIQAYADGRLDEPRRSEVEAWLAGQPDEAVRVGDYRRIDEELRRLYDPVLDEPIPHRLLHPVRRGSRLMKVAAIAAWMALGALLGGGLGWKLHGAVAPAPALADAAFARRAAIAHVTYSPEVRHPVEVGADQEAHLIAWLSKRLGTPLRAPKLDALGYRLVGGRLLPGDAKSPRAQFMYQSSQGARITLYLRTEDESNRETAFRFAREGSVRVFYWVDHRLGYALSSADVRKDQLYAVANAVYKQLNP